MAKVLLVHPLFLSKNPDERAVESPYFPLGLLYLAGYVRDRGHQVDIFDGTFQQDETAYVRMLLTVMPDIVGISALLPIRNTALDLARIAHEAGHVVIMGGPDPTKSPADYLAHPQADIVVHHEGEQTLVALLDLYDAGGLTVSALQNEPGVAFRVGQNIVINEPRPPIENLDTLPLPARDLIDMDRYLNVWREANGYSSLTIVTSRGCPYGCEWCRDAVHGNEFRQRSPVSVANEVKLLKETYQIDRLRVVDDVDGLNRQWLEEWAISAESIAAVIPFEALNDLQRRDIPMLDTRDSL